MMISEEVEVLNRHFGLLQNGLESFYLVTIWLIKHNEPV